MSEDVIVVVGAPGGDDGTGAQAARADVRAVSAVYLPAIDSVVVDLSTGLRLTIPAGVLEAFATVSPQVMRSVAVVDEGRGIDLPAPGARVGVRDVLAGILGSPDWMAGHAVRTRNLRAGQLRRLTRELMAHRRAGEAATAPRDLSPPKP